MVSDDVIDLTATAKLEAKELAIKTVLEMKLPEDVYISADLLTMGKRLSSIYAREYNQLAKIYGLNNLGKLAAMANKHYWISCHESANIVRYYSGLEDYQNLNDIAKDVKSVQDYADDDGWAYTLYDYVSTLSNNEYLEGDGFVGGDVLRFIGLYWINVAETLQENSDKFDYITEALDAFNLFSSNNMFNHGSISGKNQAKKVRSNAGKLGHIDTYALKAQAIEYWREYIDPKLSNPKAADLLIKIVPVGHRKLVEYVAEAKLGNIHPAS